MRALFVAEGGFRAGLGHLVRCRVLAAELVRRGHSAGLVLHGDDSALKQRAWPGADDVREIADAEPVDAVTRVVHDLLERGGYDWLVVDGYRFAEREIDAMRGSKEPRVLVFDDVPGRQLVADILLNQNITLGSAYAHVPSRIGRLLLGPQFAQVDRCYLESRRAAIHREEVRHVLVSFGGVDRHGRTARVVELLDRLAWPVNVDVVAGPYFPHRARLEAVGRRLAMCIHDDLPDLSLLMKDSDLMISAAGSTTWQACCVGIPLVVFQTVDNQRGVIDTLVENGAARCAVASAAAEHEAGIDARTFETIFGSVQSRSARTELAEKAVRLVDGGGAGRVVDAMLAIGLQVSP